MIEILDRHHIQAALESVEPEVKFSIHLNGLPYIPLIPSLKAYALLSTDWGVFITAYKRAVIVSARSGQSFAYID